MGIESLQKRQTFGLEELGLFDATPNKALDLVVGLTAEALGGVVVTLTVFDDRSGSLYLRTVAGDTTANPGTLGLSHQDSAAALARTDGSVIAISDLGMRQDTRNVIERQIFGASGFLAAPIHGPAGDTVATLAAMTPEENHWTRHQRRLIAEYAFLAHQQIMLRAALHTVRLMGQERDTLGAFTRLPN